MKSESKGYVLILLLFSVLGLIIYGAYSPARKAQKQQIICFSLKNGQDARVISKHLQDFAIMRREIKQVVGYSAGRTFLTGQPDGTEYDVVHYLTFQSEEDMRAFEQSAAYKQFVQTNETNWKNRLVLNADIQP